MADLPDPGGPIAVDGQWVTSLVENQGFLFAMTDGLLLDDNYIAMVVMWPNSSKWDLFWGIEDEPGSALLELWVGEVEGRAQVVEDRGPDLPDDYGVDHSELPSGIFLPRRRSAVTSSI